MCVCEGEFLYVATSVFAYIQIFKIDQKLINFGGGSSGGDFFLPVLDQGINRKPPIDRGGSSGGVIFLPILHQGT
jgi:hypothetical protein